MTNMTAKSYVAFVCLFFPQLFLLGVILILTWPFVQVNKISGEILKELGQ